MSERTLLRGMPPEARVQARRVLRELRGRVPERARVLHVGCGDGRLLALLAHRYPGADRLEGIDRASALGFDPRTRCAELDALPVGVAANYDVIVVTEVVAIVRDPSRLAVAVRRMLRPGGVTVFTAPSDARPLSETLRARGYRRVMSAERLVATLEAGGLVVDHVAGSRSRLGRGLCEEGESLGVLGGLDKLLAVRSGFQLVARAHRVTFRP